PAPKTVGQLSVPVEPAPVTAPAPEPLTEPAPKATEAAKQATKPETPKAIQLVWYDAEVLPRLRRKPAFQPLLTELESRPPDADRDDPAMASNPAMVEDRRDVFEVLARGEPLDEAGLEEALARAVRDDGKFAPPFVLVAGEVRFPFDELATLRATVS